MTPSRELLLRAATQAVNLPPLFASALVTECPWLDGAEEVSESLGLELLADQIKALNVSPLLVEQFLYAYNARVRAEMLR